MTPTAGMFGPAAEFGAYFAVVDRPTDSDWPTLAALADDDAGLRELVETARRSLAAATGVGAAAIEERTAAAVWSLGVAARIVSPLFGVAAVTGAVPALTSDRVHLCPAGPIALDHDTTISHAAGGRALGEVLCDLIEPLVTGITRTFAVSQRILRGNTASAIAGAATVVAVVRPDLRVGTAHLLADIMTVPALAGTGKLSGGRYRRASCCLYYRLPGAQICSDCVLNAAPRYAARAAGNV